MTISNKLTNDIDHGIDRTAMERMLYLWNVPVICSHQGFTVAVGLSTLGKRAMQLVMATFWLIFVEIYSRLRLVDFLNVFGKI